jgi:hypothetical protein
LSVANCGKSFSWSHKLRLAVEDNQLTWAEGKNAGVGEFTAET